jgi:hypothetical protein
MKRGGARDRDRGITADRPGDAQLEFVGVCGDDARLRGRVSRDAQ